MPGMTLKISKDSPQHRKFVQELSSRIKLGESGIGEQDEKWIQAEKLMTAYVPESADDAVRRTKRTNEGFQTYTTIQIPYTYALVMAAHTYWTSVFLSRDPVHQFAGRHGETEMSTQALEAVIAYQVKIGEMLGPYFIWIYDAAKYGVGVLGTYWEQKTHRFTQLAPDPNKPDEFVYVTREVPGYKGNRVYNISPRDFLPDPRVPVGRFQDGEFCAVYRRMSWNDLKVREAQKYYMNTEEIRKSRGRGISEGSNEPWLRAPRSITEVGGDESKHPSWVGIYEVYISLIPKDWELGEMELPEKWVFTITSDLELIIGAQPLGAYHDKYPFDVLEVEPEAYSLYNRGIPEVAEPLQRTMDWLFNSHFYNIRAIGNGRFVADPSRIDLSQLERGDHGWIATLRPEAWGTVTDINQVFQQIRTVDPTANHLNDAERIFQFGERALGIGDQIMGALSGGRKTATEVRTSAGFGVNRLKTGSEYMSAVGFSAHSQKLVQNTQQYLDEPMKARLVGDLARFGGAPFVEVTPDLIAGSYDFVAVDGTLPIDRFAQATLWKDLLGQMTRMPEIMARYDMGRIMAWVASLAGLKNLNQFQVQVAPNEAVMRGAEAGNVVPIGPRPAGANAQMGPTTPPPSVVP